MQTGFLRTFPADWIKIIISRRFHAFQAATVRWAVDVPLGILLKLVSVQRFTGIKLPHDIQYYWIFPLRLFVFRPSFRLTKLNKPKKINRTNKD